MRCQNGAVELQSETQPSRLRRFLVTRAVNVKMLPKQDMENMKTWYHVDQC